MCVVWVVLCVMCRCAGVLVCWCAGVLVYWCAGVGVTVQELPVAPGTYMIGPDVVPQVMPNHVHGLEVATSQLVFDSQ